MLIDFIGHACFRIRLDSGRTILIDPYEPGGFSGKLTYRPLEISPSLVLVSHAHPDHSDLSWCSGSFEVVRESWQDDEIRIESTLTAHDEFGGRLRGGHSRMFSIRAEGLHLVHCGDLGERLVERQIAHLGQVDALMLPVGGYYTLGAAGAAELVWLLRPRYVLPCHYRTTACTLDGLQPLEPFLQRFAPSSGKPAPVVARDHLDPALEAPERPVIVVLTPLGLA